MEGKGKERKKKGNMFFNIRVVSTRWHGPVAALFTAEIFCFTSSTVAVSGTSTLKAPPGSVKETDENVRMEYIKYLQVLGG